MQDNERMNSILDIAFNLCLEKGYSATSIRTICQLAEIEAPTLYYFFKSKKGLFQTIATILWGDYELKNIKMLRQYEAMKPLDRLYYVFIYSVQYALENPSDIKFYMRYSLFPPLELLDDIQKFLNKFQVRKEQMTTKIIVECIDQGIIKFDFYKAQSIFWNFINHHTFDVIFSNWVPCQEELNELWCEFVTCKFKIGKCDSDIINSLTYTNK